MTTILRLLTLAAAASAAIIVMGGTDARYERLAIGSFYEGETFLYESVKSLSQ